ncbi:MAG TPA: hypothetical protein VGK33_08675 [Chloroflexota bacterium]
MRVFLVVVLIVAVSVLAAPVWLPSVGTTLTEDDPVAPADAALVLEGTGATATDVAETWRQQGLVHNVVIVEAPVKTHALVAYWSDFVRWGLAAPSPTPAEFLRVERASSTQAGQQASTALPALQADAAHSVLVLGGGGIGSRLVEQQVGDALGPAGITSAIVDYGGGGRDPGQWYQNAEDRRAVLDAWLQVLVPYLSGYDSAGA